MVFSRTPSSSSPKTAPPGINSPKIWSLAFGPLDNVEMSIIHEMAVTQWRRERAQNMEAAILDMEYQIIGFGNYWMRLHKRLKELQAGRRAETAEPAKPKSKNEPGVVEIDSFQRNTTEPARTATVREQALTPSEQGTGPKLEVNEPCTGK